MKALKKGLKIAFIVLPVLFVLWIVGLFAGLKLTPVLEEDYYVGDVGLEERRVLSDVDEELNLQIPWDSDSLKAVDVTIFPGEGRHRLTVNNVSATVVVGDKKLQPSYLYVFTVFGEKEDRMINDLSVGITDDDSVSTYVQYRSVYVLEGIDEFKLEVNADYVYDGELRRFHEVFDVEHTRKLKWRGLRLPGGDH
jgi:hypothetical protein